MKRRIIRYIPVCLLSVAIVVAAICLAGCHDAKSDYLRLHIRANGNSPEEQAVKLKVRDAVVAYLTPLAEGVKTKREMQAVLADKMDEVTQIADDVLWGNGYTYTSRAYFSHEEFPERTYGDVTLEAGYYDALIIELGEGKGDNWWCVAFPPLCFVAAEDVEGDEVVFRSAIAEWFRKNVK